MAEYIEREALLSELKEEIEFETSMYTEEQNKYFNMGLKCAVRNVKSQPAADVVEVKHGEWEEYWDNDYMEYFHRCSKCKNDAPAKRDTYCDQVLTNYCPNCGAKNGLERRC